VVKAVVSHDRKHIKRLLISDGLLQSRFPLLVGVQCSIERQTG